MRHTTTTSNQFPVTAHVTVLILDNHLRRRTFRKSFLPRMGKS